jgi:tight adherence protein C
MTRLEVLAALMLLVGSTLLFSLRRWFGRRSLVERLRPYTPGGLTIATSHGLLSVDSFRDVIAPLAQGTGRSLSRIFGVSEDLESKLRRLHSPIDATSFRTRQLGYALLSVIGAVLVAMVGQLPVPVAFLLVLVTPLLVFLLLEQRVMSASEDRQQRLFLELPLVAEQLGMLLAAGYSLGGALHRVAERGDGVAAEDLRLVVGRVGQGLTEIQALREWADLAAVDALGRLVSVLALNSEGGDLGSLVSQEARTMRREAHRQLLETIERRDQQVWIPVTVAALLPGSILIGIPFIQAMRAFSNAG